MNEFGYICGNVKRDSFIIAAFRSRQQVLIFIDNMKLRGAIARVINTPHEIKRVWAICSF